MDEKKAKTSILTDTPVKQQLEMELAISAKRKSLAKNPETKHRGQMAVTIDSDSESSDDDSAMEHDDANDFENIYKENLKQGTLCIGKI